MKKYGEKKDFLVKIHLMMPWCWFNLWFSDNDRPSDRKLIKVADYVIKRKFIPLYYNFSKTCHLPVVLHIPVGIICFSAQKNHTSLLHQCGTISYRNVVAQDNIKFQVPLILNIKSSLTTNRTQCTKKDLWHITLHYVIPLTVLFNQHSWQCHPTGMQSCAWNNIPAVTA